jgi:ribosome-associated protein
METEKLLRIVTDALEELKAKDIRAIDVRGQTSITDIMVIASGSSDRQVRAIAENVVDKTKQRGVRPLGVEGESGGEWILVDLIDVVVHVMLPHTREFYNLEKLWAVKDPAARSASGRSS